MPSRGSSKIPTLPMGNSARAPRSKAAAPRAVPTSRVDSAGKPPREPDPSRIQQFGTYYGLLPVWGWTVEALVSALEGHNVGNFQASGRLAEDMTAHPWIRHGLTVRDEFFTTCPLNFTPAGRTLAEQRRSKRCADFVREIWPDVMPLATLKDLHRHELFMGQGIYAIDWEERRDGRDRWWIPCVKPWEPSLTGYRQFTDPDSIDGGGYTATTLSHGLLRVQPGGGRWGMFSRRTLRPWLGGIVRVLGEAFTGDGYNFRDNMTHQDRWGRGIVKLKYLRSLRTEEVNAATASLVEGGGGGVLQCPVDETGKPLLDADLLRADGAGYQTFDATEKRILRRVLIALLRQDMTTTGTTGIADNDPRQMSLWKCREDDATTYGDARCMTEWEEMGGVRRPIPVWEPCDGVLRQHLTRWIAHFNFGEFDLAPYVWWDATPPDDYEQRRDAEAKRGQQRAATLQALSAAVKGLAEQGVRCDVAHLADQCGMTLVEPDENGNVPPEPLKTAPKPQGAGSAGAQGSAPAGPPPAALPPASGRPGAAANRDVEIQVHPCAARITGDDLSGIQVRISAAGAPFHAGHTPGVGPHGEIGGGGGPASGGQQTKLPGMGSGGGGAGSGGGEGKTLYDVTGGGAGKAPMAIALHHEGQAKSASLGASAQETKPVVHADDATRFFGEHHGITRETLAETFSSTGVFKATGGSFSHYGDTYSASFTLTGNDGKRVGSITRKFMKDASGNVSVYHSYFELEDPRLQGSGAAKDVFRKSVQMYEKIGVKEITVTAGLSKGRYVWASYGFEAPKREVDRFRYLFKEHIAAAGRKDPSFAANGYVLPQRTRDILKKADEIKSMQHLADFEHGGEKLGKNWLLNVGDGAPMWHGKVTIDPRSRSLKRLKEKIGLTTPKAPRRRRVKNVDTAPQNG